MEKITLVLNNNGLKLTVTTYPLMYQSHLSSDGVYDGHAMCFGCFFFICF